MEQPKFEYSTGTWIPAVETFKLTQEGTNLIIANFDNGNIPEREREGNLLISSAAPVFYQNVIRTIRLLTCYIDFLETRTSPQGILHMSRYELLIHQLSAGLPELLLLDSWLNEWEPVPNLVRQLELNTEVLTEDEKQELRLQLQAWLAATP